MGRRSGDWHALRKCNAKKISEATWNWFILKLYTPLKCKMEKHIFQTFLFWVPCEFYRGEKIEIINIQSPNWQYHSYSIPFSPHEILKKKIHPWVNHICPGPLPPLPCLYCGPMAWNFSHPDPFWVPQPMVPVDTGLGLLDTAEAPRSRSHLGADGCDLIFDVSEK